MARHSPRKLAALLALLTACATTPSELDVHYLPVQPTPSGPAIHLRSVTDEREFVGPDAAAPDRESVLDIASLDDPAETLRSLGGRYGSGRMTRVVKTVPGRDVRDLAREVVTRALEDAGYRVLAGGETAASEHSVDVRLLRLWIADDGHSFYSVAAIRLDGGPVPALDGTVFEVGGSHTHVSIATADNWTALLKARLDELVASIGAKAARTPSGKASATAPSQP